MASFQLLGSVAKIVNDIAFEKPNQSKNTFWQIVNFDPFGNDKKLAASHNNLEKMITVTAAAVLAQEGKKNLLLKKLTFGSSFSKYMLKYNEARLIAMGFYRKPQVRIASKIWNTPEMGAIKQMSKINLDSVGTNEKIWIPVDKFQLKPNIHKRQNQNSVRVRVLYHKALKFYHKNTSKFSCCDCNQESENAEIDTIMIHMHGGGFISMSSSSMQIYTRKWANYLKIPIFSIDYRMPPDHPFPQSSLDCLAVYEFLINHISYYMNINPKNIILAGDSAGGNLAASLTVQIMKKGLLMPKGIFLAYPALDLRKQYSPSLFHSFTDPLLKPSVLLLCLNQYLNKDINNALNPIASPLLATQEYLYGQQAKGDKRFPLKWPKTIIFVGKKDPLYDNSVRLAQKLFQNKSQFKIKVYQKFSHGFFNLSFIIPQCDKIIKDSQKSIKEQLLSFIQKDTINNEKKQKIQNHDQETIFKSHKNFNLELVQSLIDKKKNEQPSELYQQKNHDKKH